MLKVGSTFDELTPPVESEYLRREVAGENETSKAPQREEILKFFLEHHPTGLMKFFSFPGVAWRFENLLSFAHRGPVFFVGLEWRQGIFERSSRYMPGHNLRRIAEQSKAGDIDGFQTDQSRLLHLSSKTFFNFGRGMKTSKEGRRRWAAIYKDWTACWLDFTSCVGEEICDSIRNLDRFVSIRRQVVPVAITFMLGREGPLFMEAMGQVAGDPADALRKRLVLIQLLLENAKYRTFKIGKCWTYKSECGATMVNMTGFSILR